MPIYEYQCTDCGHELEVIQKLSDEPLLECPACSKNALKKRVSAAAFRLKGGGWYETDFKSGDKKKNLAAAGESGSKEGGASAGKDSSKSEAASPSGSKKDSSSNTSSTTSAKSGGSSSPAS